MDARPSSAGVLTFTDPGAEVRIRASTPGTATIEYQALPLSCCGNTRGMTPILALRPGVWRQVAGQERSAAAVPRRTGRNEVLFEVTAVEPLRAEKPL
jgi:hypothetical protein